MLHPIVCNTHSMNSLLVVLYSSSHQPMLAYSLSLSLSLSLCVASAWLAWWGWGAVSVLVYVCALRQYTCIVLSDGGVLREKNFFNLMNEYYLATSHTQRILILGSRF